MGMPQKVLKYRHRTDWRGRLILQVFIDPMGNSDPNPDGDGFLSSFAHWRDARASDITWSPSATPQKKS